MRRLREAVWAIQLYEMSEPLKRLPGVVGEGGPVAHGGRATVRGLGIWRYVTCEGNPFPRLQCH